MLETYLDEQELDDWSEEEFSLANRDLGPELLLNSKLLEQYRFSPHAAFLYYNLTQILR